MREVPSEVLVEYVDEQTPDEAPPFEYVERAVRTRRRRRNVLATVAAVIAVVGAVVATVDLPRAEQEPAEVAPTPGFLDDGPPPTQFKVGTTLLVLAGETQVSAVRPDPDQPSVLIVEVPRDPYVAEVCVPSTVVRILAQDSSTVRIAAYRYVVGSDQTEGRQCVKPDTTPAAVHLDLRQPLDGRTVYVGSTGYRTLPN